MKITSIEGAASNSDAKRLLIVSANEAGDSFLELRAQSGGDSINLTSDDTSQLIDALCTHEDLVKVMRTARVCRRCWGIEHVAGVALRFGDSSDELWTLPRPNRHHDLIREYCKYYNFDQVPTHEQGFVTNFGLWLRRPAASSLAHEVGQIAEHKRLLTSEDLW